jgi:uncharacterized membrane protein
MTLYITGKAMTWALFVVIMGIIFCYYIFKGIISMLGIFFNYLQDKGENNLSEAFNIFVKTLRISLLIAVIFFSIQYLLEKFIN